MDKTQVRRVNLHGMALQFAFWFGCCTYIGFFVSTLIYYGWEAGTAALVVMTMSVMVMFTEPLYGYVSDRLGSEKRICVVLLLTSAACVFVFPFALESGNMAFVVMVFAGFGFSCMQIAGLMDAWIVGLKQENEAVNYGLIRGTGAGAFALSAQVSGMVTASFGHEARLWMGGVFFLLGAVAAITFRPSKREVRRGEIRGLSVVRTIFSSKRYCLLLATAFFLFLSNAPMLTLLQLLIPEFGGTTAQIGTAIAMMAVTEVPFMFMTAFLIRKAGYQRLFVMCGAFWVVRLVLTLYVGSVNGLIAVQMLQGLTFAVAIPVAMSYLAKVVDEKVRSTAVTIFSVFMFSIPGILANLITSAWISAGNSAQSVLVFFVASAFVGLGLAVFGWISGIWGE
ncbi:MAG: MFS transporter [Defluviitaleaceae bacterium]|nr:MFS transporter [Defluviitaleaceae bacterium]